MISTPNTWTCPLDDCKKREEVIERGIGYINMRDWAHCILTEICDILILTKTLIY